jgi:DNA-directed RNA polymerase specialized sigma24 family protein
MAKDERLRRGGQLSEASIPAMIMAGCYEAAARVALETQGAGLFGFLIGVIDDIEQARVVYADVCQRVAGEIRAFRGRSSFRAWLYGLARRELRDRRLRRQRGTVWGTVATDPIEALARPTRPVPQHPRATLTEEERELLILRNDRGFSWEELAFTGLEEHVEPALLTHESRLIKARVEAIFERIEQVGVPCG